MKAYFLAPSRKKGLSRSNGGNGGSRGTGLGLTA